MATKRLNKRAAGDNLSVPATGGSLTRLGGVNVAVSLELGRAAITLEEAQKLGEKSLLAVDKLASEPVEVYVNGKLCGHGKLVMVGDNYGVQLIEVVDGTL